jgi:hypothetical protein
MQSAAIPLISHLILPTDVLEYAIFVLLPEYCLVLAGMVCRQWRVIVSRLMSSIRRSDQNMIFFSLFERGVSLDMLKFFSSHLRFPRLDQMNKQELVKALSFAAKGLNISVFT